MRCLAQTRDVHVLEEVPRGAQAEGGEEVLVLERLAQHDDRSPRGRRGDVRSSTDAAAGQVRVDQADVGAVPLRRGHCCGGRVGLCHHLAGLCLQRLAHPCPRGGVVVGDEHAEALVRR